MADNILENDSPLDSSPETTDADTVVDANGPDPSFVPGQYTSFDFSEQPFAQLTDDQKNKLQELVILASRTDVASRRFEVEQAWEARLFERGYQHLLPRRGGGWSLPGEGSKWGPLSTADSSALYSTNIYGRDRDIIVGSIAREVPEVVFFPQDSTNIADVQAAEGANKYQEIYEKNNDLRARLAEIANYYYTDDRVVMYTRQVVDAQSFGTNPDGSPRAKEITSVYGKLEAKVPVQVSYQSDMQFIQLYEEMDVSNAKARYPWAAKTIKPGDCGIGEIELDKIARVNTRLALLGSYVTGDALMRDVTHQMTWFRPSMFFDDTITDEDREFFLETFPKGCLVVFAGTTFCFARNESMDERLHVTHAMPGNGQNRRALGTSNISVQKRLNAYLDIMDDFFRRTVPRRIYDDVAFDIKALRSQDNVPGGSIPMTRQPGVPVDQLVFVEPTPQPQPALPDFIKAYFEDMPASLSGAVPSLYGASTNTDTVGGIAIQRDQALGRIGIAWNAAKTAFACAARQAVIAAATRQEAMHETLPDGRTIDLDPSVLRGSVLCYPEYDQSFPESPKERELRYTELVQMAPENPFAAQLLAEPRNMRAIAENLKIADLVIPGEDSVKKQLAEIVMLKQSGPQPNPEKLQAISQFAEVEQGYNNHVISGEPLPDGAEDMMARLPQMIENIPDEVPSIPVAQDASENHKVEGQTCFDWLNGDEGIKFKYGTAEQQAVFQNILLHWQGHTQMAQKLAPQPESPAPHISIPFDKLPPEAQTQALGKAGIKTTPKAQAQTKLIDTQHKIATRVVPKTIPESINVHKLKQDKENARQRAEAIAKKPNSPAGPPR